uniref:PIN domain-containing protein n=1 Tax=Candidatus Kentrum eta TaxID=2126337 RepID=A0A450UE30_9GAMM|nr:MAG: hypothetical protein BECKH772A_GA0070896_1001036 [Candidatus Kentron sp. H]VFJ90808.1 MAG: hypothetical protein BECKH772B_GA0070898_1001136 [Candidatus Kentron sp. H]VFJ96930.1 MAG: hypothetical protein BECKH772C_GA0070978_1000936 [Candidatus Kentron sp. H]
MASALIDTNLFLLLVVGATDKKYIAIHKRTRTFTERDFDELLSLLDNFDALWITAHCLAEVSNLLKQTNRNQARELLTTLSVISRELRESHITKADIFSSRNYLKLGVADTGFVQKSKRVSCSFTTDHDLYQTISNLGGKVINFNHVRARYLYP